MPITKKHKSILFSGIALMAGAILLTGCASDPLPVSKSEQYTRDFIKTFGTFDQSHDWNHATQSTVTVTTPAPTEVKIMADFEGKRYIFASYTNVEGTKTLNVDIPKGISDLIVAANGREYEVKAGGEIRISSRGSRTFGTPSLEGDVAQFTISKEPVEFDYSVMKTFIDHVKEGGAGRGADSNLNIDIDGELLVSNFSFISDGDPITFYPLYWQTGSWHALGVYWLDNDGSFNPVNMKDLYYTKSGELEYNEKYVAAAESYSAQCYSSNSMAEGETCPEHGLKVLVVPDGRTIKSWQNNNGSWNSWDMSGGAHYHMIESEFPGIEGKWEKCASNEAYNFKQPNAIRSKGVTLTMPEGVKYGFYLKVSPQGSFVPDENGEIKALKDGKFDHIVFSQAIRNKQFGTEDGAENTIAFNQGEVNLKPWSEINSKLKTLDIIQTPLDEYVHASFASLLNENDGKTYTYFAFEDHKMQGPDLNDIIFVFDSHLTPNDIPVVDENKPKDDPEEWEWIIACEDLGTNDFDFNDVVFSVSWPKTDLASGEKKVKVKALAAGGTLPVYLYYKENELFPDGEPNNSEFHKWFGNGYNSNQVINAASLRATGKTATVTVDSDFTMACTSKVKDGNMGGFRVKVEHSEKPTIIGAANPNVSEEIGKAPQMICVPSNWCWPKENTFIRDVYTEFHNWCADMGEIHWHDSHAASGYWDPDKKCTHPKKQN